MKENCHKAGTSDDFEMKFRPVLELEKQNSVKRYDLDFMFENYDFVVIFPIYV